MGAGRRGNDRWSNYLSGPGSIEEPVVDDDVTGTVTLKTNPTSLDFGSGPRKSVLSNWLTAPVVWRNLADDELLYDVNPIEPSNDSDESEMVETRKKRRMIIDYRACNELCSKPEGPALDEAFINQRTISAGGWIDGELFEPFNYPRIRKDDPRKLTKYFKSNDDEHDGVPQALTYSVGRICEYHRAYMASRLILVTISLLGAVYGFGVLAQMTVYGGLFATMPSRPEEYQMLEWSRAIAEDMTVVAAVPSGTALQSTPDAASSSSTFGEEARSVSMKIRVWRMHSQEIGGLRRKCFLLQ